MDDLIKTVCAKTGVDAETVQKVATACLDYVKAKVPAPLVGQIEALLAGNNPDILGDVGGALGGLFGKK